MMNNEERKNWNYHKLVFNVYKVEVGVLLDKDDREYECYNNVYDKNWGYYDENVVLFLDYNRAVEYAKSYVNEGVNKTYSIISKLKYDSEKIYNSKSVDTMNYVARDINYILGGGYVDDINIFKDLYSVDNVIYSLYKYLGKENEEIIENFVRTKEEMVVEFMFDNDFIIASEYDHWFEDDIIDIDNKVFKLYLALEEIRKLHLAVEEEQEMTKNIEDILIKYENKN